MQQPYSTKSEISVHKGRPCGRTVCQFHYMSGRKVQEPFSKKYNKEPNIHRYENLPDGARKDCP